MRRTGRVKQKRRIRRSGKAGRINCCVFIHKNYQPPQILITNFLYKVFCVINSCLSFLKKYKLISHKARSLLLPQNSPRAFFVPPRHRQLARRLPTAAAVGYAGKFARNKQLRGWLPRDVTVCPVTLLKYSLKATRHPASTANSPGVPGIQPLSLWWGVPVRQSSTGSSKRNQLELCWCFQKGDLKNKP